MRPAVTLLGHALIAGILDEAKRILAETGMEIRGAGLRARLLELGLPTDATGRVLFPRDVVDRALAAPPR